MEHADLETGQEQRFADGQRPVADALPAGTHRITVPVEARIAYDQGQRARACTRLRDHVDELRDIDHIDVVRMAAAEFVHVSAGEGR